jgi:hypothetical protein
MKTVQQSNTKGHRAFKVENKLEQQLTYSHVKENSTTQLLCLPPTGCLHPNAFNPLFVVLPPNILHLPLSLNIYKKAIYLLVSCCSENEYNAIMYFKVSINFPVDEIFLD